MWVCICISVCPVISQLSFTYAISLQIKQVNLYFYFSKKGQWEGEEQVSFGRVQCQEEGNAAK